ncbi:uncharacterized protein LOC136037081 isoform X1 [Artemia franciscana]|uniref:uncharacterized protein LOC136037081 isoform X1 n=1 Tax=Artemia franciscana TaxID=6661 RepID=UPI0032DAAAE6
MNFLGVIGYLIQSSGLEELLSEASILLPGTAKKAMVGKPFYRCVRAHLIVLEALSGLHWNSFESYCISSCTGSSVFDDIAGIIASATDGRLIQVELSTHLNSLTSPIAEFDNSINTYPTSKLWLQYIRMVLIMLQCLLADRCGNWDLHLKAIRMMPPFMASTGHNKYAIYLTMYLQDMERVPEQLREQLLQGHITVERSVGSDNAVSPDHALESSLNLEAKQKGGIKGLTLNGTAVAK